MSESKTNNSSSLLHFKFHRLWEYLSFWVRLPYHASIHHQEYGYNIGFIICDCGYVVDLGVSYGQHCEGCYTRLYEKHMGDDVS